MNIKHPELLILIALIPVLVSFLYISFKRRSRALSQLADSDKLNLLFPKNSRGKTILRLILMILAFTMFITALISPRWGYDWKEVESKGTNIMVAIDVSASMLATDIQPSRLTRAKLEINKLIEKLSGDRIGLIVFAGDAFLQAPLTLDYLMVEDWVNQVDINSVSSPGTSIKSAIDTAEKAFTAINSESKALIIISDGEEQDEETLSAASRAHSSGINVYTIGVGTEKGSPIDLGNGLLRDTSGNIVISKLKDDFLEQIADSGGGYYVRSTGGDFHLDQLYYDHVKASLGEEVLKSGKSRQWYETYQIFIAIALVALIIEFLLSLDFGIYDKIKSWFKRKTENIFQVVSRK